MCDGYGHVAWWGFSPALDLQGVRISENPKDELNILIIGAGDPRHIFKTMAWAYRHAKTHLHFYVIDSCVELYARHMLLLSLIMESAEDYGLQEKTELYLEIFGNTLIRGMTDTYITGKASDFIRMVTDSSYLQKKLPYLNLESLKYKEVDGLEAVFKFWRNPNRDGVFDIAKFWDLRVRQYLGTRYDSKEGIFDWDYYMKLREKNTETISKTEYKKWRQTGIAFEIREGEYTFPNATLSSVIAIKHLGETHYRRGYWGEVVTSPYVAFGLECEEKDLLKKADEPFVNSAQDISYHNVISLLHELTYGEKYDLDPEKKGKNNEETVRENVATLMSEVNKNDIGENISFHIGDDAKHTKADNGDTNVGVENTSYITFLPVNSLDSMYNKSKYHHFFDVVYFSNSSTSYFSPGIQELLSDNAVIIIETLTFILNMDTEFPKSLLEKMKGIAADAKCEQWKVWKPAKAKSTVWITVKSPMDKGRHKSWSLFYIRNTYCAIYKRTCHFKVIRSYHIIVQESRLLC